MNQTYEMLMAMKKVIDLDSDYYYILTINKKTHWEGVASFHTNGENKLRINEGASDGSDDHSETVEDFLKKYEFRLERF